MKVQKIFDKGSGLMNEDQILVRKNLFAVFDGATSLNKYLDAKKRTGGFLASAIAKKAFSLNNKSLIELANLANKQIQREMLAHNIDTGKKENIWRTGLAVVKINGENLEWLQIADCLILIINKDQSFKLLVKDYDHDRAVLTAWKNLGNIPHDKKWEILKNKMLALSRKQNIDYGVLNGDKKYIKFIKKGKISLKNIKHIILFTDGLIPPKEDPRSPDAFDQFVKNFLTGGLVKIKKEIRDIENKDPQCHKFPRYKKHDDIAAISITL